MVVVILLSSAKFAPLSLTFEFGPSKIMDPSPAPNPLMLIFFKTRKELSATIILPPEVRSSMPPLPSILVDPVNLSDPLKDTREARSSKCDSFSNCNVLVIENEFDPVAIRYPFPSMVPEPDKNMSSIKRKSSSRRIVPPFRIIFCAAELCNERVTLLFKSCRIIGLPKTGAPVILLFEELTNMTGRILL